jgi:hypothetical protein
VKLHYFLVFAEQAKQDLFAEDEFEGRRMKNVEDDVFQVNKYDNYAHAVELLIPSKIPKTTFHNIVMCCLKAGKLDLVSTGVSGTTHI